MPDELLYVSKAAKTMRSCVGTPKERLIKGAAEFAVATKNPGQWPPELLAKAKKVCESLFIDGTLRGTVTKMDNKTATAQLAIVAKGAEDLSVEIEKARSQGRIPSS
jgi:hypothetical protein